jgi:anionic cell wall polymer biosynthesis LytR-Cps2A-Psr (LCP) family protein
MAQTQQVKKKKKFSIGKLLSLIVIVGLVGVLGVQVLIYSGFANIIGATNTAFDNSSLNVFSLFNGGVKLKGQDEGRTNVLLFGINESDGDGAGPVDSNIILSYFHTSKKLSTVSIMRDLRVDGGVKINAVYPSLGVSVNQNKQYGEYIGKLFQIPIHYTTKINMKAMTGLVDTIGNIEVDSPVTFRDDEYPKMGDYSYKYCPERGTRDPYMCPSPRFNKGINKLDGTQALIYARSRKGVCLNEKSKFWYDLGCVENGDDARGRRQQIVIQAIASKLKADVASKKVVLDSKYLQNLFNVLGSNVSTSLNVAEAYSMVNNIKDNINLAEMKKITLSYQSTIYKKDQLLLCTEDGSTDLTFCNGTNFTINNNSPYASRLRAIVQNPLDEQDSDSSASSSSSSSSKPKQL